MGTGPVQVQAACEAVLVELAGAFPTTQVGGSLAQWAGVLGSLQQVVDTACAAQDAVIARLAAIEPVVLEDGTIAESHRGLGHAALDTPAIVAGVLNVAPVHAEHRVRAALALAADGPAGTSTATGLGGLHQAMATGALDTYRASVIAAELAEAPPEVAATVVAALQGHFGSEDAAHLRRRCRRVLARISPDLLVQRARRARQESGLRRWADEPGVDKWVGTFPSEEAAHAWAAIDALAHQYRQQGACPTIERARAKALTDLVTGNATIDTIVTVTVPATALPETDTPGTDTTETVVPDTAVPGEDVPAEARPAGESTAVETGPADPVRVDEGELGEVTVPVAATTTGEGKPGEGTDPAAASATGEGDLVEDTRSSEANATGEGDLVEVTGPNGAQPAYVARSWLTTTVERATTTGKTKVQVAVCHPATGALLDDTTINPTAARGTRDAGATGATGPYRPSPRMATRIKTRDRRCRFPGCTIAAVFCDIDHVRPWPHGPTHDTNLLSLCRRHHRIKQRLRWHLTLTPDGIATWTDPTGRVRTTHPANALHTSVLPDVERTPDTAHPAAPGAGAATGTEAGAGAPATAAPTHTSRPRTVFPDGPHSALEFHLEHHTAPPPGHTFTPVTTWRDQHGRHRAETQPIRGITLLDPTTHPTDTDTTEHWPCRRTRRPAHPHDHDPPPF